MIPVEALSVAFISFAFGAIAGVTATWLYNGPRRLEERRRMRELEMKHEKETLRLAERTMNGERTLLEKIGVAK